MKEKTIAWLKAVAIRVIKTMAETAIGMIPVMVRIQDVDWVDILSVSATAGAITVLFALKGLPEVKLYDEP